MMLWFQQRAVWQQRGSRQASPCRLAGGGQIRQPITLRRAQGEHDGQHPGDERAAFCALRPKAGSPPDHGRLPRALRRVVGRLDTFHTHKPPEGFLDFEQRATGSRGPRSGRLLPPRGLVGRTLCEPLLDSRANLDDGRRKRRPCAHPLADTMPPLEQRAGLLEQALADRLRFATAVSDLLKRADQRRPAPRPPLQWPPTVAAPPIRHPVASKLAQQRFGRRLAAAQRDLKDLHPGGDQDPQPGEAKRWMVAIAVTLHPARLIRMGYLLGLRKLRGLGHRLRDFLPQRVERPQRPFDRVEVTQRL
jgi:hypothetical protein